MGGRDATGRAKLGRVEEALLGGDDGVGLGIEAKKHPLQKHGIGAVVVNNKAHREGAADPASHLIGD